MKSILVVIGLTFLTVVAAWARGRANTPAIQDSSRVIVDDIRFEASRLDIDTASHMATVELTLTNLKETPRELKINVYGTQLIDNKRNAYYFSAMTLGRVLMRFGDKQNYLHYLLQPDKPATLTITAENISSAVTAINLVKITFEDSGEGGRFLDAYLAEEAVQED